MPAKPRSTKQVLCRYCRYCLAGCTSDRCPECGTPVAASLAAAGRASFFVVVGLMGLSIALPMLGYALLAGLMNKEPALALISLAGILAELIATRMLWLKWRTAKSEGLCRLAAVMTIWCVVPVCVAVGVVWYE